ncbi:MAG: hypothetical protein KKA79_07460, partial [Nanoarchaeota archaeon]|nr:hypothetical protein [Nanoarchaeota archaeon]
KNKEFRVLGQLFAKQASKQALTHSKLYYDNLENKPLWNSCSFKKIIGVMLEVIIRGQSNLWSFESLNLLSSPFLLYKKICKGK